MKHRVNSVSKNAPGENERCPQMILTLLPFKKRNYFVKTHEMQKKTIHFQRFQPDVPPEVPEESFGFLELGSVDEDCCPPAA